MIYQKPLSPWWPLRQLKAAKSPSDSWWIHPHTLLCKDRLVCLQMEGLLAGLKPESWGEYNRCQIAPIPVKINGEPYEINQSELACRWDDRRHLKPDYWSTNFQWLPCEIPFKGNMMTPRITPYINDIHPSNKAAYKVIETLIGSAIAPWNGMFIQGRQGRTPIRN